MPLQPAMVRSPLSLSNLPFFMPPRSRLWAPLVPNFGKSSPIPRRLSVSTPVRKVKQCPSAGQAVRCHLLAENVPKRPLSSGRASTRKTGQQDGQHNWASILPVASAKTMVVVTTAAATGGVPPSDYHAGRPEGAPVTLRSPSFWLRWNPRSAPSLEMLTASTITPSSPAVGIFKPAKRQLRSRGDAPVR